MPTPNLIKLDDAVSEIKQACEECEENTPSPFFFMVGAGISCPSVALAETIIRDFQDIARKYGRYEEPASCDQLEVYSHWFEKAYIGRQQRQRYFRDLIEDQRITHANLRLAHLLLDSTITNIVVTTNFDDFLARSLLLFGKTPIVCDHPQTVSRINLNSRDVQIVQLHGTYWFYDFCNLKGELRRRAKRSKQRALTMGSLLEMLLRERSPIVIGYSGWEGDVFMTEFQQLLANDTLKSPAYWFCYSRDSVNSMPRWLKNHENLRFVVPPESSRRTESADANQPRNPSESRAYGGEQIMPKSSSANEDIIHTLPADRVLDKFIRAFKLEAPPLTNDPIGFFADQLVKSLPQGDASDPDTDFYEIKNVLDCVLRAKQREDEERQLRSAKPAESLLEEIRDARRTADYRKAIKTGPQLRLDELSVEQLTELADMLYSSALKLYDNSEEEILAYDLVVAVNDRLSKASPQLGNSRSEQVARALVNKGVTLETLERREEAIAAFDEVVHRFGQAQKPELREQVARVLVSKGFNLGLLGQYEEEIAVYDELLHRYGDAPESVVQKQIAQALINKGVTLGMLDRGEEEIAMYDEVVRRYGEATEIGLRERVARALFNKAVTQGMLNRGEDAIAVYDEVLRRYGEAAETGLRDRVAQSLVNKGFILGASDRAEEELAVYDEVVLRYGEATEIGLRKSVAQALLNKGVRLGALNRGEEEIAVYDELLRRYGEAVEIELREPVSWALFNKAVRLKAMARVEEEIAVYDEVVRRYREASEPVLREQVARSLNGIGFRSIIEAKAARLKNDVHRSHELLKQADKCFAEAIEQITDIAIILGNQAYAAFLCGRKDKSRELLQRAIALGGEAIRATELEDADINRLPDDDEFCELVRSIPASPSPNQI